LRDRGDSIADDRLGIPLAKANIIQPPSGETKVTIVESVRDYDVYILNTVSHSKPSLDRTDNQAAGSVNTSLMELCIMIHACKVSLHIFYR
jgi:ribose-phosphate pyrophosphokinase